MGLEAGAACLDITPPLGLPMAGYRRTRYAKGVHDPLQARALVLDDGEGQIALVGLDLICISGEQVDRTLEYRRAVRHPPERVMFWATHTYTGPINHEDMLASNLDPEYMAVLTRKMADSVQTAQGNLKDARWRVGVGCQEGLSLI